MQLIRDCPWLHDGYLMVTFWLPLWLNYGPLSRHLQLKLNFRQLRFNKTFCLHENNTYREVMNKYFQGFLPINDTIIPLCRSDYDTMIPLSEGLLAYDHTLWLHYGMVNVMVHYGYIMVNVMVHYGYSMFMLWLSALVSMSHMLAF